MAHPSTAPASSSSSPAAPTRSPSERELEALRNRDPDAVERWIYSRRDFIYSVLLRYTNDAKVAEDLVQETFLQALRSLPSFRGDAKLTTWLYSIAKNVALTRARKCKRHTYLEGSTLERVHANASDGAPAQTDASTPEEDAARNQEIHLLQEAMDELSDSYREVIALRDLNELSTREVAEQLGLTRVNVRVRLHRARKALRDVLQPRLGASRRLAA